MLRTFAWERSGLRLASCCTAPSTRYQRLLHTSSPFFSSTLEEVKTKERSVDPLPKRAKMKMEPYVKNLFRGIIDPNVFAFGELDLGSLNVLKVMKEETEKFMNAEASLLSSPEVKISAETVSKLKDLGVFKLNIPQEYGGLEATLTEITYLMEIFSRNPSLFQTLNVHLHYVSCLFSKFASDEQKSKYLPALASGDLQVGLAAWEDEAGTDLSNIKCHSTFTGSKYILSGTKKWVCNGGLADKLVVFARDGFGGSVGSVSCFLVDKNSEGVSAKSMDTLGLNSYNAWEVTFDKTSVPKENLVGEVGQGLDMFTSIFFGKFSLAASYIGILRDLLTTTITHAINRETFKKPLIQHDLVKQRISEVTCSLYALESVAYLTTDLFDNIEDPDLEVEMAIVKLYSCETMISVVQKCLSILGSDSYLKDKPYARILQDALFYPMVDTSVDTQRMTIALLCLQHVGKFFQGSVMQRRNPLFFPQKTLVDYFRKTLKLGEEVKGYKALIHEHCHPCFEPVSETLEKTIMKFQLVVEETLVKWGSEIDHQQMNLARFADIAVDLYVCTAVLGRATRSISIGLRNCDTDGFIANTIILESCDRISRNFEELDKSPYQNSDANHISIVDTLLHERKYYAPHPLERNW